MRRRSALPVAIGLAALASAGGANAQTAIVPDTSAAAGLGTVVGRNGTTFAIDGGARRGANLFHSFAGFDLAAGDAAVWFRSVGDGAAINTVISRVTGGRASTINGTLATSGMPNASFYFINPAGVVLGAGASVAIPNAVYFSTAAELRFADGGVFAARTPSGSTFSVAAPQAFGFLGPQGAITLNGVVENRFSSPSTRLSFSAGAVTLNGSSIAGAGVDLFAAGTSAGQVPVADPLASPFGNGQVVLSGSLVDPQASPGGTALVRIGGAAVALFGSTVQSVATATPSAGVQVSAGRLQLDDKSILGTFATAGAAGGPVSVTADVVDLPGGIIATNSIGTGRSGSVTVNARQITISNVGSIGSTVPANGGPGGDVTINADSLTLTRGLVNAASLGVGASGSVNVNVRALLIDGGIITTNASAAGNAGAIRIAATDMRITNGGAVSSEARAGATGSANDITINANGLTVERGAFINSSTNGRGRAGQVSLTSDALTVTGNSVIASSTFGAGAGGGVSVKGGEVLVSDGALLVAQAEKGSTGAAGSVSIDAVKLTVRNTGNVASSTSGPGTGGDVAVRVGQLGVENAFINADTYGSGRAGSVTVNAADVVVSGALGRISSQAQPGSTGTAGSVTVSASNDVTLGAGAFISSAALGTGSAGAVTIRAPRLTMNGGTITSSTIGPGAAGPLTVEAPLISMSNVAELSSSSFGGTGAGGLVTVKSSNITIDRSGVFASTDGAGAAGSVDITTGDLTVVRAGVVSTSTGGSGDAGSVRITAANIRLESEGVINSEADPGSTGRAGGVTITTGTLSLTDPNTAVRSATFARGDAGAVSIKANAILVENQAFISSQSALGTGNAGSVTLDVADLTLRKLGIINSVTSGAGNAGSIGVVARSLVLDGSVITSGTLGSGNGGTVLLDVGSAVLSNGGYISSDAFDESTGDGGQVAITAGTLKLDLARISSLANGTGNAGDVDIQARVLTMGPSAEISSSTRDVGRAGNVTVGAAESVTIDGGLIASQSQPGATGDAGFAALRAPKIRLIGGGGVSTSTFGRGIAGSVFVSAGDLQLDSGVIASSTFGGTGDAGSIQVSVDTLAITNGGQIVTNAADLSRGNAGEIRISTAALRVEGPGSQITSQNLARTGGSAGSINVFAQDIQLLDGGEISTNAASGPAGNITLTLPRNGRLLLRGAVDPGVITTSSGPGTGGRITLAEPYLILSDGGRILALGEAGGANVVIRSDFFLANADQSNRVSVDGALVLDSEVGDLSSGAQQPDIAYLDASAVLGGQCPAGAAARGTSQFSSRITGPYAPVALTAPIVSPGQTGGALIAGLDSAAARILGCAS